ncbi:MAG: FimB/Mfa2 family fimbrial subunit [Prevotellaceae bacterium]|uniref:hypothetical protein n=1 Tax=Prevotella heparinolytica TaxID=28113 RepID=UPI002A9830D1|nr:FimB/Mfa2 family fimbrial subunit [Prevotella sp.]MDD7256688.1 FimB/Mfa2 family fimbrial subunit [Prevotellaceae bacterium]MDY6131557.1 FimB/Mfa2 family fimbrial subunit [Prevotella sp.]
MKKQLLLIFVAAMALVSCEKAFLPEDETGGNDKKTLRIAVDRLEQADFGQVRGSSPLRNLCTKLTFVLFDEEGGLVARVNQGVAEESFGNATINVEFGNYHLLVVAYQGEKNCVVEKDGGVTFNGASKIGDTFWYYGAVSFGETSSDVSVVLKRVVAKMEIRGTDALPSNVKKVSIKYSKATGTLDWATGYGKTSTSLTKDFEITDNMVGKPPYFEFYTFPHQEEESLTVKVCAYDANGALVLEKVMENVPIRRNAITRYSGNLFNNAVGISVSVDDNWEYVDYQ